jgi:hypothetical protein
VYNHDLQYHIPSSYLLGDRQPGNHPQDDIIFGPSRESWPSYADWQEGFSGGMDHRRLQHPFFYSHHGLQSGFEDMRSKGEVYGPTQLRQLSFPAAASEMLSSHARYMGDRKYDADDHQDDSQRYRGIFGPRDMDKIMGNRFGSFDAAGQHEFGHLPNMADEHGRNHDWRGRMFRDSDASGHLREYSTSGAGASEFNQASQTARRSIPVSFPTSTQFVGLKRMNEFFFIQCYM